jgi:two-component system cell cycle response regulator DivK
LLSLTNDILGWERDVKKKILIVEDDLKNQKLFRDILEKVGYKTILASDGEQGVQLAQAENPDLILMDIQLPVKDGLTATREIKRNPQISHIPVWALTAMAMKGDKELVRAAGCDDYISKPVQLTNLIEKLSTYFNR